MYAAAVGNAEGAKFLLEKGADPNIRDEEGKSALDHSARYPEIQTVLRSAGAR
jgi:ankyrin repeat protein